MDPRRAEVELIARLSHGGRRTSRPGMCAFTATPSRASRACRSSNQAWALPSYENKAEFEDDGSVTHRSKVLVAKAFENVPLSIALSAKRAFDSGEKELQLNVVVTYFFR